MRNWLKRQVHERAVVYSTDNHSYDGLLSIVARDGVVLFDAHIRTDENVRLAGEVFIPREKVRFVQIVARDAQA